MMILQDSPHLHPSSSASFSSLHLSCLLSVSIAFLFLFPLTIIIIIITLSLSLSLVDNTKTNPALFLAHETFNISFQILADENKIWPNESFLLSATSAIKIWARYGSSDPDPLRSFPQRVQNSSWHAEIKSRVLFFWRNFLALLSLKNVVLHTNEEPLMNIQDALFHLIESDLRALILQKYHNISQVS